MKQEVKRINNGEVGYEDVVCRCIGTRMLLQEVTKKKVSTVHSHPPWQYILDPNPQQTAKTWSNFVFPMYSTTCPWILHFSNRGRDRCLTLSRPVGGHLVVGMKKIWWCPIMCQRGWNGVLERRGRMCVENVSKGVVALGDAYLGDVE